jgi:UDP-N-acetylglucosamine diphosphorylase / glucose-1-phosphate thymidylyltransferase / UDP-N-acetylgalactosamine diphosphorylase / glucosamine-1-phosphate N-acetyltransferase / galactosamine-1-phosphate N-acetyltransferase
MKLVFVDDAIAKEFHPFALTRPSCELRAGALLVRQRWEMASGEATRGFLAAQHLGDFDEPGAASVVTGTIPEGSILVNSRCAVGLEPLGSGNAWTCGGKLAAIRLRDPVEAADIVRAEGRLEAFAGTETHRDIEGRWLERIWDLVRLLPELLLADIPPIAKTLDLDSVDGLTRLGTHEVFVERGATIEPHVVFDAQPGPILVRRKAVIQSFARIAGPCVIGEGTLVNGGRVTGCSIGENCRVQGDVSTTIFIGFANKGHDGFIGHSVLGRWVNLGAGTVNSNLKNNYSGVALWTPRGIERTGMQFLGSFLGDHAKTAIGTRLTTGAVIGTGANVYGHGITSRYVPPFSWGLDGTEVWDLKAFLETAERAMKRRDVPLSEKSKRQLTKAWQLSVGSKT